MDAATLQRAKKIQNDIAELDYHADRLSEIRCPSAAPTQELFEKFKADATIVIAEARQLLSDEFAKL